MNLLVETIKVLKDNGFNESDVVWVGCSKFKSTWENFKEVANVEYDEGFGSPEVAEDLIVMGNKFWLERHEYDGSEWWECKCLDFVKPTVERKFDALTVGQAERLGRNVSCGWESLSRINGM